MNDPIKVAAQSVYKLHVAALETDVCSVLLYPLMDGFYATASDAQKIIASSASWLADIFSTRFKTSRFSISPSESLRFTRKNLFVTLNT